MHRNVFQRASRRGGESSASNPSESDRLIDRSNDRQSEPRDIWRSIVGESAQQRQKKVQREAPGMLDYANKAKIMAGVLDSNGRHFDKERINRLITYIDRVDGWIKGKIDSGTYKTMRKDYRTARKEWNGRHVTMLGKNEHLKEKENLVREASAFLGKAAQEIDLLAQGPHYAPEGPSGFAGVQHQHYAPEGSYEQPHPEDQWSSERAQSPTQHGYDPIGGV